MKPSINLDSLKAESLASPRILIPLAIVLVLIVVGLILPLLSRARRADKKAADDAAAPAGAAPDQEPASAPTGVSAETPAAQEGASESAEAVPADLAPAPPAPAAQEGAPASAEAAPAAAEAPAAPEEAPASFLKGRYAVALVTSSFFVLTLFLFNAARIYISNFMEFDFLFHESLLFFLAVSAGLIGVVFAALALISPFTAAFRITISILFTIAFLMWFQSNIFLWQYGVLNGRDIDWGALVSYGIMDTIFWAALLAFAVVRSGLVYRISRVVGLFFILLQLLSVGQLWLAMPKDQGFKAQEPDAGEEFVFSDRVNVIVLVLDTFQSDLFQDAVAKDPGLGAAFDGFTYFRNALAGSDATSVSIPDMLTASNYDNSVPYLEYVKTSFLENSIPKTLQQYGFTSYMYPIIKYSVYTDFSGVKPVKRRMDWRAYYREQAFLADLALFRNAPHFLKRLVYNNQAWLFSGILEARGQEGALQASKDNPYGLTYSREYAGSQPLVGRNRDVSFIHRMMPAASVRKSAGAFKLYHLNGMHLQLDMNENLTGGYLPPTRANMLRQAQGVLKITSMFLDRLRQIGAYDNSLIFIVGDHGSGISAASINPSARAGELNTGKVYKGLFSNFKSAGIPMILVKRMGGKGALVTSDAPVSLGDIPQTVVDELKLEGGFPGESMFRVGEGEARTRIYRAFYGPQEDVEYFAPIYEYAVNGRSWDDQSWAETGTIYFEKKGKK